MDDNRSKLIELFKKKHSAYKDFFETKNGQLIMKDLEETFYIHKSTINTENIIDPTIIASREGQRSVVLRIKNLASGRQLKFIEGRDENIKT